MAALQLHALSSYCFLFVGLSKQGGCLGGERRRIKAGFRWKDCSLVFGPGGLSGRFHQKPSQKWPVTPSQIYPLGQTLLVFPVSSPTPQGADQLIGWSLHFSTIER